MARDPYVEAPKNREEDDRLIQEFIAHGGEVIELEEADKISKKSDKKEREGACFVFDRIERNRK